MPSFADILALEIEAGRQTQTKRTASLTPRDFLASSRARGAATVTREQARHAAKRRFRARVLETHPDRGGSASALIAVVRDYEREIAAV